MPDVSAPEEIPKRIIERDERGRLLKGSVLNSMGGRKQDPWKDLKRHISNDLDFLYSEAVRLIKYSDNEKVKASMVLGLLNMLKPKVETSNENFNTLSHATMQNLYEIIVKQEEELKSLRKKSLIPVEVKTEGEE